MRIWDGGQERPSSSSHLVDGGEDGAVLVGQPVREGHHVVRHDRVQPCASVRFGKGCVRAFVVHS